MMRLSVVIVSYNAREELERCLRSVFDETALRPLEVIVIDNASSDGSASIVEERFAEVIVMRSEENLGFGRAANLGWRKGTGELVLFLNADTILSRGAIDRMVAILLERDDVGVLGPRLMNPDGTVQLSFGRMMSLSTEILQKLWNAGYRNGSGPLRSLVERAHARESARDWVSGACLMTRRALLLETGGFDGAFFMYAEDVDLCARIRALGKRVLFTPEVEVTHLLGRSAAKNRERALYESHRSRLYFYSKHYDRGTVFLLKLYLTLKCALSYLLRPGDRSTYRRILLDVVGGKS